MITTRAIKSFKYNVSKYTNLEIEDDMLREFKGRSSFPVYIGRVDYFRSVNYLNARIIEWSSLKKLFDLVNERCINMDDLERSISTDGGGYHSSSGNLRSISRAIFPFRRISNYIAEKF